MKKDALYYGVLAVFVSFFLMFVFFIYDVWKSSRMATEIRGSSTQQVPESQESLHDYSRFEVTAGTDGTAMVLIPEGPFQMGSPPNRGDLDEFPRHAVYLPPFYLDLKEITQEQFARFSSATGHPIPVVPVFEDDMSLITGPGLPVVAVSWDAAATYCEWADKRLPTEAEWEKAAGGEQSYKWPWGDTARKQAANILGEEDGYQYLAPPGKFEAGRSPYGAYDMVGNAAEWVSDWYDLEYYKESPFKIPKGPDKGRFRVYRGGSWNESIVNARAAKRFAAAPHQTSAVIGFRCARDSG